MDELKEWLHYQIELTRQNEEHYAKRRDYPKADQQIDFRAALQKVLTKIDLMERQNESS